jgi:hypothetical protein
MITHENPGTVVGILCNLPQIRGRFQQGVRKEFEAIKPSAIMTCDFIVFLGCCARIYGANPARVCSVMVNTLLKNEKTTE